MTGLFTAVEFSFAFLATFSMTFLNLSLKIIIIVLVQSQHQYKDSQMLVNSQTEIAKTIEMNTKGCTKKWK